MINLLTTWQFFFVLLIINFISAFWLKIALINTVRENKWLKYLFIIPPTAILCWLMAVVYLLFTYIKKFLLEYFKD